MAITAQTKVLTLDWWKPANKLAKGDYVFDRKGRLVQVTLVQEYRQDKCYEVMFSDYLTVSGDEKLEFLTENQKYRDRTYSYKNRFQFRRPLQPKNIDALYESTETLSVPTADPLQLPHQDLPVPPFVFGFWFFNRKRNGILNAPSGRHEEVTNLLRDYGYKVKLGWKRPGGRQEFTITPTIESQLAPNIPKEVPYNYLLASPEQRLELLRGIVLAKSAQYNPKLDRFRITSQNQPTISRIQALVESLGSKTTVEFHERLKNYTLYFKTRHQLVENQVSPPVQVHYGRRFIDKITTIPAQMCVHIETDGDDNTILVGEGFIPCR